MVDIPLLPAQTDAAALDQLEVAVRRRLDQFLQSGCIWLVQQMGPHSGMPALGSFECMYGQPDAIGFCELWRQSHAVRVQLIDGAPHAVNLYRISIFQLVSERL
jgi:hypothetical protein